MRHFKHQLLFVEGRFIGSAELLWVNDHNSFDSLQPTKILREIHLADRQWLDFVQIRVSIKSSAVDNNQVSRKPRIFGYDQLEFRLFQHHDITGDTTNRFSSFQVVKNHEITMTCRIFPKPSDTDAPLKHKWHRSKVAGRSDSNPKHHVHP